MIELNEHTRWILGRPNFWCMPIANALRKIGYKIKPKAEDEQAVVIHWMLEMYKKYGDGWKGLASKELEDSISERLEDENQESKP